MEKITKPSDTVLIDPNEPLILPDGTALVGRVEWFLYALCCLDYQNLPTPMSRIEEFANALITGEIPNVEPQSRAEQFFLAILDGNVSNLPKPQSRSEVLLDKLARGEFDLSDVEPIQSRYELLLAYLIKNGGIGNIDYVLYEFSEAMKTMYNTVEKPFKSLELSGNTKVNVLQESVEDDDVVPYQVDECQGATLTGTKETGSLDNLVINGRTLVNSVLEDTSNSDYVSFDQDYEGQSFAINGTNEGAIKSAILSGCTLVNGLSNPKKNQGKGCVTIVSPTHLIISHGENIAGEKASVIYEWFGGKMEDGVDYTLDIWILKNTMHRKTDPNASIGKINFNNYNSGFYSIPSNTLGHITYEVTTSKTNTGGKPYIETFNTCEGELEIQMVVRQGRNLEPIEKHFEGMASCEMPVLTTTGKNLFDESKKIEGFIDNASIKEELNTSVKNTWTTTWIKAKPNTSYTMQGGNRNRWQIKSRSNVITFVDKKTITTLSDTEYIRCYYCNETYTASNVQLEEATSATSYEPYKSNILYTPKEVVLKNINGIKDTLNCNIGEYVKRIEERVFNGSEAWVQNGQHTDGSFRHICNTYTDAKISSNNVLCDKMSFVKINSNTGEGMISDIHMTYTTTTGKIQISTTKTLVELKEWLSQNPITVQYELATPITKTVDLSIVDQSNTKIDKMHVFNEATHVNASSDELTPTVNIGKSVSYPTIIKPNTKYTVDLKRNDKPLTVNLGGTEVTFASGETRKVITTPSTLTNDKLSYYGMGQKCSDIMVLEGEVEGNVDYFTGMQSVANPIIKTYREIVNINNMTKDETVTGSSGGVAVGVNRYASDFIKIDFDKIYINSKNSYYIFLYDKSKKYIGRYPSNWSTNPYFEITQGYYFKIVFNTENGEDLTSYVYDKSTILSCNEDVVLRQVGDVKDVLCHKKNIKIKRIGEITLNGSENWIYEKTNNYVRFKMFIEDSKVNTKRHLIKSNLFSGVTTQSTHDENTGFVYDKCLYLYKNTETLAEFKQWLSENQTVVQYELENPITEQIDLSIVDQDNITRTKLHTFNDTTHIMTSSDELTPIIKCDGKLEYPVVIKPSTQYTILANTSANAHALNNITFDLGGAKVANTFGTRKITVTTPSTLANNSLTITGEGAKIGELMVLEGNESDTVPYFEGMSSCKMPILTTTGKNLLSKESLRGYKQDVKEIDGWLIADNGDYGGNIVGKALIEKGKTYTLSTRIKTFDGGVAHYCFSHYGKNDFNYLNGNKPFNGVVTFTATETTYIDVWLLRNGVRGSVHYSDVQLEEGSVATAYEPYKSSILSLSEEVKLCGIDNTKDMIDCNTKTLIKNINEVIFDGSDDESWRIYPDLERDNTLLFQTGYDIPFGKNHHCISDKYKHNASLWNIDCDEEGIMIGGGGSNYKRLDLRIAKNKLSSYNVNGLKLYLQSNPITIQYKLANPIIETVDLNIVDQDGNTIPKIKSYKDVTHLEVTVPKQSLLPNISAEVATDNSKDMSSLTVKHQEISEAQSVIQNSIQSQSDEIDTAMMATTEIFESILE